MRPERKFATRARTAGLVGGVLATLVALSPATPATAGEPHNEHGWGDGAVVTLQITQENSPADPSASTPEYVIAPVVASSPLNEAEDGFGPFDLTVRVPRANHGSYSSKFRVLLVVPDENASAGAVEWRDLQAGDSVVPIAYAVDFGSGMLPLTSADRVEHAASLGLVDLVDIGISEVCHVVGNSG